MTPFCLRWISLQVNRLETDRVEGIEQSVAHPAQRRAVQTAREGESMGKDEWKSQELRCKEKGTEAGYEYGHSRGDQL